MEKSKKKIWEVVIALSAYTIAMALVESAVVIYLRELYYPSGFFIQSAEDLAVIPYRILRIELWREMATIIMLIAISYLTFQKVKEKILAFVFAFSIWDIFYYLFLYIFLSWPPSLTTLDIYFLIPWLWIGPVWVPLILFSVLAIISLRLLVKRQHEAV